MKMMKKQNFVPTVGELFVVKEIRTKLGQTFEILGYIAIALGTIRLHF